MMKKMVIAMLVVCCGCGLSYGQASGQDVVQLSDPVKETEYYRVFGSSFDESRPETALNVLIDDAAAFDSTEVSTEGIIKQVCQKKGCFFMLETDEASAPARITFKEYSFFIPTNAAGSRVKLNGTFQVKTISEEDARHFAEDTGKKADAIKGPQKEYGLVATSVVIYK